MGVGVLVAMAQDVEDGGAMRGMGGERDRLSRRGDPYGAQLAADMAAKMVDEAKRLEDAGAALLDFTNSGPVAGEAVVKAVSIPVIGGFGGGPWLDGRMRMAHAAIGYGAAAIESKTENYANVARIALDAISAYAADVRAARQIKGATPAKLP